MCVERREWKWNLDIYCCNKRANKTKYFADTEEFLKNVCWVRVLERWKWKLRGRKIKFPKKYKTDKMCRILIPVMLAILIVGHKIFSDIIPPPLHWGRGKIEKFLKMHLITLFFFLTLQSKYHKFLVIGFYKFEELLFDHQAK